MSFVSLVRALRTTITLLALAFCVAALLPAVSRAQTVEWRGVADLYGFTAACADMGYPVGGRYKVNVRFRPSGIEANGASSRLSFFDDYFATSFIVENGRFTNRLQAVLAGGLGTGLYQWPGPTQVRVSSQTPNNAGLSATTPFIRMVGEIRGIETVANCRYSFDAVMLRRQ